MEKKRAIAIVVFNFGSDWVCFVLSLGEFAEVCFDEG
jgi:hypothetical protein